MCGPATPATEPKSLPIPGLSWAKQPRTLPGLCNCRVNVVEIPPQSSANYSNIELNLTGGLLRRAQCYASGTEEGGQISGTIEQDTHRVYARAIGTGPAPNNTLDLDRLHMLSVDTIPAGSKLRADDIQDKLQTTGELGGDIETNRLTAPLYETRGTIHVQGTGLSEGDITIYDDMVGGEIRVDGAYAGTMTIGGMGSTSEWPPSIRVVELIGTIRVSQGSLVGTVDITGTGESTGNIVVDAGDVEGTIEISGDMSGDISAEGLITGSVVIDGVFNGDICASNLSSTNLPSNVEITEFGPDATVCSVPVGCDATMAAVSDEPDPVYKNRYISFMPPPNGGEQTAIRVKFVSLPDGTPDFSSYEGQVRWVGPMAQYPQKDLGVPLGWFSGARLSCEPYFADWSTALNGVLHVFGPGIVPSSVYEVQVIHQSCAEYLDWEGAYSNPLTIDTQRWGDVIYPFFEFGNPVVQPTLADVGAVVDMFKGLGHSKPQCQLWPNMPDPTDAVEFRDIGQAVNAFKQLAYPYDGPGGCPGPDTPICSTTTACTSDANCGTDVCSANAFCTELGEDGWDACERCIPQE